LQGLKEIFQHEFGVPLPQELAEFWLKSDGLDWNGLVLLPADELDEENIPLNTQGLIQYNLHQAGTTQALGHLVLGWNDMLWFTFHLPTQTFHCLDRATGASMQEFHSLTELLVQELSNVLPEEELDTES
jgi:hypothetical protein